VTAVALFEGRAMLAVDDNRAKIIKAGTSYKGVKLLRSNTSEAVIEVEGERQTLRLNGTATLSNSLGASRNSLPSSVTLYENDKGFFETEGQINGGSIRFLVDTGANIVVLNSGDAERLNIDYKKGIRNIATTASGEAPMFSIELDKISIGGITLENVQSGVIEGAFPTRPLLGMTFLGRLDMNRKGGTMVLRER